MRDSILCWVSLLCLRRWRSGWELEELRRPPPSQNLLISSSSSPLPFDNSLLRRRRPSRSDSPPPISDVLRRQTLMTTLRKRYFSSLATSSSSPNPFDASREYMDHSDVREFGFKRQQLLGSSSSYFGPSPSSSFMYSGSCAYAGQLPQFPVVRLRGLPFDCADSDILEFFNGLQILDILFVNKGGRFSGEAFCVMAHALQVDLAIQRNRQNMGRRYIEVFRSNKQEYYSAVAHEVSDTRGNSPRRSAPVARSNDDGKDLVEHTGVLRMRGLPYSAGKDDIMDFFKDYQLSEETVHIVLNSNGRPAGEAYVEFANAEDSKSAMGMDRMTLGSRYIELFPSTAKEMNQAISKANEKWPGLPRGVKFYPSDEDLLCYLLAEIGKGEVEPHPFINEFIVTLEDNGGFGSCHPYTLPGVKQDGSASYFFHRSFKAHVTRTEKRRKILNGDTIGICWHKVGKSKQLYIDGIHTGSKRIMALYMSTACSEKPEKTNWVMHQFHAGIEEYEEDEFVLSKIFYQKCRPGGKNTENLPIIGLEAVGTEPHAWRSNLTSTEVPAQVAFHDTEAEKINAHVGWRQPGDNDGLPTEESQKENTQLQFLLGHQQKGDSILAVGELRCSQPSCGIQVDPHLTDNAHLADDSLKKVMEDQTVKCQAYRQRGVASSKCDLLEHSILANHASQVMVGPSDYKQENFYREGLNSVHVPDMGAPQEYDSDQLDHLTLQERRNLILSSMNDAQHYCLDLKFSQDEGQPCTYDSSHTEDLKFSQDEGQPCTYDSIHTKDSVVIPERQRHGDPMSNLESIAKESSYRLQNVSSSSLLDKTKNANAFPADQTKSETQPANEGLLHDECYVHHAGHDARKSTASVFIGSPKSVILGEEFGSVNANLESRSSAFPATLVAVKAEPVGEIPVTCISESSDATPYSSNMSAPALPSSIAPSVLEENVCLDDPSSSRYKFHQKHKNGIRSSDEWGISDARQSFLDQRHVNENAHNPHSSLIISVFPLEVKAEPVEGSSINVIPEENIEELASSIVSADFREEHISGNCNASYQASDPKDSLCSSNGSQFSTTRFCSLGTVIPESSCLINCCAATGSIPEVDFGASNKLPDSVSPNCLERPKLECVENGLLDPCQTPPSTLPEHDVQRTVVKSECFDEVTTDVIDHIPLYLRMHTYKSISEPTLCNNIESSLPTPLSPLGNDLFNSDNVKEKRFSLRRKKKKTATDSVETALEEDAPGLLQFLLDRGITAEEIKLYGETEDDEPLQDSSEDSFKELETVMTKLFSEGPSFFKLALVRHVKGSKALYCLACLISLIEQARYLRFRHSPVEWGWCRDLQSFIFVFESHNRIVLERPEYGYATYFFELVATLPTDWQIKRLVTAMKLPCCSRSILLENKPLLVGVDLSEGEARVLEEYGWMRNSGIGTLLNFCDRVVHDKKNETYSLEWRGKIAKLLMRGHDSGRTVLSHPPKRAEQYFFDDNPELKLEPVFE